MPSVKCEICGLRTSRVEGKKRTFMAQFPLDEDRCKQWVKITGKEDLAYVPIEKLHQLKHICGNHFRPKDFKKKKTQLRRNAVPCIGITAEPLSDEILSDFPLHLLKKAVEQHLQFDAKGDELYNVSKIPQFLKDHTYYTSIDLRDEILEFNCDSSCMTNASATYGDIYTEHYYSKKEKHKDHSYSKSAESKVNLHKFPNPEKDRELFNTWVYAIGGDILKLENSRIFNYRRVCHVHFETKYLCRNNRITKDAVPRKNMSGAYMHRFPHPERLAALFEKWMSVAKLKQMDPLKIFKNKKVCDYHFPSDQKVASHRLKPTAVPTLHLDGISASPGILTQLEHSYCIPRVYSCDEPISSIDAGIAPPQSRQQVVPAPTVTERVEAPGVPCDDEPAGHVSDDGGDTGDPFLVEIKEEDEEPSAVEDGYFDLVIPEIDPVPEVHKPSCNAIPATRNIDLSDRKKPSRSRIPGKKPVKLKSNTSPLQTKVQPPKHLYAKRTSGTDLRNADEPSVPATPAAETEPVPPTIEIRPAAVQSGLTQTERPIRLKPVSSIPPEIKPIKLTKPAIIVPDKALPLDVQDSKYTSGQLSASNIPEIRPTVEVTTPHTTPETEIALQLDVWDNEYLSSQPAEPKVPEAESIVEVTESEDTEIALELELDSEEPSEQPSEQLQTSEIEPAVDNQYALLVSTLLEDSPDTGHASQESRQEAGPVFEAGCCRCCGSSKRCRLLNAEYTWQGEQEVYSDMFLDCFGLVLSHLDGEERSRLICATCVSRLREAAAFRRQVLRCEERLLRDSYRLQPDDASGSFPKVEEEVKMERDEAGGDSDADRESAPSPAAASPAVGAGERGVRKRRRAAAGAERGRQLMLREMERTSQRLRAARAAPEKRLKPHPKSPDSAAREKTLHSQHNLATLIEFSFACPFATSFSDYYCAYCRDKFTDADRLRQHTMAHDPAGFKDVQTTKIMQVDIYRIDCRLCPEPIADIESFKHHIATRHGKLIHPVADEFLPFRLTTGRLSCVRCGAGFEFFHALRKHMADHYGSCVCDVCGARYFDERMLVLHQKTHRGVEQSYACAECGKAFRSQYTRRIHVARAHTKEPAYQCARCDDVFFSYMLRYRHMIAAHGEERVFACARCDRAYDSRKSLREHTRRTHLRIMRHQCTLCDKRFYLPSRLREHMSSHTGERNFRCERCGKSFPRLRALHVHAHSHAPDKRYKCDECGAAFTQNVNLKNHIKRQHRAPPPPQGLL